MSVHARRLWDISWSSTWQTGITRASQIYMYSPILLYTNLPNSSKIWRYNSITQHWINDQIMSNNIKSHLLFVSNLFFCWWLNMVLNHFLFLRSPCRILPASSFGDFRTRLEMAGGRASQKTSTIGKGSQTNGTLWLLNKADIADIAMKNGPFMDDFWWFT